MVGKRIRQPLGVHCHDVVAEVGLGAGLKVRVQSQQTLLRIGGTEYHVAS